MTLNFNLPHETIYSGAKINQVIVPGAAGEYGVTADHVPLVAQLKPGVLQIMHEGTSEAEKYFVAGGFSITHANSITVSIDTGPESLFLDWSGLSKMQFCLDPTYYIGTVHIDFFLIPLVFCFSLHYLQDISCPEAVKVDDIDSAAVTSAFEKAKAAFSAAEAGSRGAAEAQIDMEVYKSMAGAVGVTLA